MHGQIMVKYVTDIKIKLCIFYYMCVNKKVIFSPPIKPPFPHSVEGMSLEMAPSCRRGCAHHIQFLVYFNTDEMMVMVNSSVFFLTTLESHKSASLW